MSTFSHLNTGGEANMVDVSEKATTVRQATAEGYLYTNASVLTQISDAKIAKGDVFAVARVAGIQGAKRCADLIPLCHPLGLDHVAVDLELDDALPGVRITAKCMVAGRTGIEMEAMTAVSVAALTIYDMCKAVDRGMRIGAIRLTHKSGGKSGDFNAA